MSHTQGQRIAWTVPEGRDNDCWDPYFVWALTTGRLPEDDDRPYLVQRISNGGETAFSTEMARLSDGSPGFVDEKNVVRWQLGAPRNASYINLSDYADVEVRPTHTDVIAAVLDDGCPLLNKAFRDADGRSRIRWLWHQGKTGARRPGGAEAGNRWWYQPYTTLPPGQTPAYGAELSPAEVDQLSSRITLGGDAVERESYRALRYLETPEKRRHGASVMTQVLNAYPPFGGSGQRMSEPASDWPLIFVQFPENELKDTSGGWLGVRVLDGLHYIIDRARRGGFRRKSLLDNEKDSAPIPVVATLSYGGLAGAHDGESLLEEALNDLQDRNPHLTLVMAAGNAYGRAVHASAALSESGKVTFELFIPPDNPNTVFVEFWLPQEADLSRVRFEINGPCGASLGQTGSGCTIDARNVCSLIAVRNAPQGRSGAMVLVSFNPTRIGGKGAHTVAGVWQVAIEAGTVGVINGWIERDDMNGGLARAQQARFLGEHVREDMTLSSPANAQHTRRFVVGSVIASDGSVSGYSASGPSSATFAARMGPDLSAIGDAARTLPGIVCDGVRSGERYRAAGTSVAAGAAAHSLIIEMQRRRPGNFAPAAPDLRRGVRK